MEFVASVRPRKVLQVGPNLYARPLSSIVRLRTQVKYSIGSTVFIEGDGIGDKSNTVQWGGTVRLARASPLLNNRP